MNLIKRKVTPILLALATLAGMLGFGAVAAPEVGAVQYCDHWNLPSGLYGSYYDVWACREDDGGIHTTARWMGSGGVAYETWVASSYDMYWGLGGPYEFGRWHLVHCSNSGDPALWHEGKSFLNMGNGNTQQMYGRNFNPGITTAWVGQNGQYAGPYEPDHYGEVGQCIQTFLK